MRPPKNRRIHYNHNSRDFNTTAADSDDDSAATLTNTYTLIETEMETVLSTLTGSSQTESSQSRHSHSIPDALDKLDKLLAQRSRVEGTGHAEKTQNAGVEQQKPGQSTRLSSATTNNVWKRVHCLLLLRLNDSLSGCTYKPEIVTMLLRCLRKLYEHPDTSTDLLCWEERSEVGAFMRQIIEHGSSDEACSLESGQGSSYIFREELSQCSGDYLVDTCHLILFALSSRPTAEPICPEHDDTANNVVPGVPAVRNNEQGNHVVTAATLGLDPLPSSRAVALAHATSQATHALPIEQTEASCYASNLISCMSNERVRTDPVKEEMVLSALPLHNEKKMKAILSIMVQQVLLRRSSLLWKERRVGPTTTAQVMLKVIKRLIMRSWKSSFATIEVRDLLLICATLLNHEDASIACSTVDMLCQLLLVPDEKMLPRGWSFLMQNPEILPVLSTVLGNSLLTEASIREKLLSTFYQLVQRKDVSDEMMGGCDDHDYDDDDDDDQERERESFISFFVRQPAVLDALVAVMGSSSNNNDDNSNNNSNNNINNMLREKRIAMSIFLSVSQNICNRRIIARQPGLLAAMICYVRDLLPDDNLLPSNNDMNNNNDETAPSSFAPHHCARQMLKDRIIELATIL